MTNGHRSRAIRMLRIAEARLRFVVVLALALAVGANYETLRERLRRVLAPPHAASLGGDPSREWYCPMDPLVVRASAGNCSVCGMALSERARGAPPEAEDDAFARVALAPHRIALGGIDSVVIGERALEHTIRAAGRLEIDARSRFDVPARVRSRIEDVKVLLEGTEVRAGDELATIYSPELVNVQQVFLQLVEARDRPSGHGIDGEIGLLQRERPLLLGFAPEDLDALAKTGEIKLAVPVRAPRDGTVLESNARRGRYVDEGEPLYRLADLGTLTVEASVFQRDAAAIALGDALVVDGAGFTAPLASQVEYIAPTVDDSSLTVSIRGVVANAARLLRPGTLVSVTIRKPVTGASDRATSSVLAVPASAVLGNDSARHVFRETAPGVYDAVGVTLGPRCGEWYPVRAGLTAGERVVAAGAFLLDSERRLGAVHLERPDAGR